MKLRNQLFLAAAAVVLVPLLAYTLFDSFVTRQVLIEDASLSLRQTSQALLAGIEACSDDRSDVCSARANALIVDFTRENPDFEVLLVNPDCIVVAGSEPRLLHTRWFEP